MDHGPAAGQLPLPWPGPRAVALTLFSFVPQTSARQMLLNKLVFVRAGIWGAKNTPSDANQASQGAGHSTNYLDLQGYRCH